MTICLENQRYRVRTDTSLITDTMRASMEVFELLIAIQAFGAPSGESSGCNIAKERAHGQIRRGQCVDCPARIRSGVSTTPLTGRLTSTSFAAG